MEKLLRTLLMSSVLAGALVLPATASSSISDETSQPATRSDDGLQLAQAGDVEIYYDEYGRRVVVDAYTGEVLSVERPRRRQAERRAERRQARRESEERYYLDDPADMDRLARRKQAEDGYEEGYALEDDGGGRRAPDGGYYRIAPLDEFPAAPPRYADPDDAPAVAAREPIEREPLAESPAPPRTIDDLVKQPTSIGNREDVAALQILLDRKGASPGVIDGKFGSNVDKSIAAYREITGENLKSTDREGIQRALAESGGDAFITYTITAEDAAGPYVASIPADYGEKAKLDRMSYTTVVEMLGEKFHMDEGFVRALNPEANFNRQGTVVKVANIGQSVSGQVTRIVADKAKKQVRAYDASGAMIAAYPATIGSSDTPSPTGTHAVSRIAVDPDYTYNPKLNFKQGDNTKVLTIPPGPNGPVGSIWIALDKPTYGIHGTPEPSKIGKTESHGCVRLTNWDAGELAKIVKPTVPVEFLD